MSLFRATRRLMTETDPRLFAKFAWNFGHRGRLAVNRFKRRLKRGEFFPAFVFVSPTNACNFRCQGCWVEQTDPPVHMAPEMLRKIIDTAMAKGSYFFGLLGGEPLLYPHLFDIIADYPQCYFQVFTNGSLLTDDVAARMRKLGNVTPLVSVEGLETVSDERRGSANVYDRAMNALAACRRHKLITGVATSVCASNFTDLVSETFINDLVGRGVHYMWYYIFRPAGGSPCPELALREDEIVALRQFIVDQRLTAPMVIVDAYWDHLGRALCPAAVGISHHVNPVGDIEPCPPIQFACDNVGDRDDPAATFGESRFLAQFRESVAATSRGCILLEQPGALARIVASAGARDTSGRDNGVAALRGAARCPSHDVPGREIPERSRLYRVAKKNWFFGFGAYG